MREFAASVTLARAPDTVWRHMSDVVHWPDWMETFRRVEPLDAAALAVEGRFRIAQPRLRTAVWTVTHLEPLSFTWENRAPGLCMVAGHTLAPCDVGTLVQLRFSFVGWLSPIAAALTGKLVRHYLALECAAYERRVDS